MIGKWSQLPMSLGKNTVWKRLEEAYRASMGTALSFDENVYQRAESYAMSRVLYSAHNMTRSVAYAWTPNKMTWSLERWEAVLRLRGRASLKARRDAVADKFARFRMKGTHQALVDLCVETVGADVFAGIHYTTAEFAASTGYSATVPGGLNRSDPNFDYADGDWRTTVCQITIKLAQPSTMDDGELYELGGAVLEAVEGIFPAYVRIDWAREEFGFILGTSLLGFDAFDDAAGDYSDDEIMIEE